MTVQVQWMQFLPTPEWIEQSLKFDESVSLEARQILLKSWPLILAQVDNALRWAVVEDNPQAYLKSEDVKNCQGYCLGRRFFEKHSEQHYWIEIECCFLTTRPDNSVFVWKRCIVTLLWNIDNGQGQLALSRVTGRLAKLSQLDYRKVDNFTLEGSGSLAHADTDEKALLLKYWPQVIVRLSEWAKQAVEDGSFGGELDDIAFPNAIEMTGEFSIEDSLSVDGQFITVFLRFQRRRQYASQINFDYLGEELGLNFASGIPVLEWNNSSVI